MTSYSVNVPFKMSPSKSTLLKYGHEKCLLKTCPYTTRNTQQRELARQTNDIIEEYCAGMSKKDRRFPAIRTVLCMGGINIKETLDSIRKFVVPYCGSTHLSPSTSPHPPLPTHLSPYPTPDLSLLISTTDLLRLFYFF